MAARHRRAVVLGASTALAALSAWGQQRPPEWSLQSSAYLTDNGAFAPSGERHADVVGWLRPGIAWQRRGPRLDLDLDARAALLASVHGTQAGRVQPDLRASAKVLPIEEWLAIDAAVRVQQVQADLFGPEARESLTTPRRTETSYLLRPRLEHALSPTLTGFASHEQAATTNGAGAGTRETSRLTTVGLVRTPLPWGGGLQASRLVSASSGLATSQVQIDSLRASASVRAGDDWILGLAAGRDHSRFLLSDHSDPLVGLEVDWRPGPRTALEARLEHRFFGAGGTLRFQHRQPTFALLLTASRQPATLSSSLGVLPVGGDLRPLLDAILTTRYPDPAERGQAVTQVIDRFGLASRSGTPVDLVAAYPQLRTAFGAELALLGRRNVASLEVHALTATRLDRSGDLLASLVPALADSRQWAATARFDRRLDEQLGAGVLLRWSRVTGLALRSGESSREWLARAALVRHLSPRTTASVGLQTDHFGTNVPGQTPYRAAMLFVGYDRRF